MYRQSKNVLNSIISSIWLHNMVNFGPLSSFNGGQLPFAVCVAISWAGTHYKYHLVIAEPPFTVKTIVWCTRQDLGRANRISLSRSTFTKSVVSVTASKIGVVVHQAWSESHAEISFYLNKVFGAIQRFVGDKFVFQQNSAQVYLAFNTVQRLQWKTLNFFSPVSIMAQQQSKV